MVLQLFGKMVFSTAVESGIEDPNTTRCGTDFDYSSTCVARIIDDSRVKIAYSVLRKRRVTHKPEIGVFGTEN